MKEGTSKQLGVKEITLVSGKGGTGKTSLSASFSVLAGALDGGAVTVDCDVDAANLGIILPHQLQETHPFAASRKAEIEKSRCLQDSCGLCQELCRFGAVTPEFQVDTWLCEGCGVCYHACPVGAVSYELKTSGEWFISATSYGPLVHASLGVAEENSGKLVTLLRQQAHHLSVSQGRQLIINDGPPGIGCPVIASLGGTSLALLVAEPSSSGVHDLERVVSLCRHFGVEAAICINRGDLHRETARQIKDYAEKEAIPLVGELPFDPSMVDAVVQGVPVVEYCSGPASKEIVKMWDRLKDLVM